MYEAYGTELLNQKESQTTDSDDSIMSDTPQHPLYVSTRRLVNALDRLENNLMQVTVARDRDVHQEQRMTHYERENAALRQERESLNAAIAQLQYQYNDLHKVAATIYSKLDDSVKRLTQIIEE